MGRLTPKTFTAPAHWASALVNKDRSGLSHIEGRSLGSKWLLAAPVGRTA